MSKQAFLAIAIGSIVVACGSATPEPVAPSPTSAPLPPAPSAAAAPSVPAPVAWRDDFSNDEKAAFMKASVTPRMGKVFQSMNAQHYAGFGCKTCHGPEGKPVTAYLPRLTMKDGNFTCFAERPEVSKFMAQKVVPEMASILGEPPYNPATKTGFGCMGCHAVDMK